jgi:hypothetical protein
MNITKQELKSIVRELIMEIASLEPEVEFDAKKVSEPLLDYVRKEFDRNAEIWDMGKHGHVIKFHRLNKEMGLWVTHAGFAIVGMVKTAVPFNTINELKYFMEKHLK